MTDINRVFIVGRLTRDADLRFTTSGAPVSKFSIAVNRSRKVGEQWEEEVSFFDIVLWGRSAENLSKYLVKGKQIAVDGELRQNRWEQDGQSRSRVEVHANNIQLLGGTSGSGGSGNTDSGSSSGYSGSSRNAGQAGPSKGYQSNNDTAPDYSESGHFDDDGIPF